MSMIIGTILVFAFVFGILVFVHEFGHFFMAKLVGIRVEVFSWGYGKRLLGIKKGETDYRISIIPLGGFVKFSGEEALDQKKAPDERDFMAKKRWERFLVLVMGSVMNVFLAVGLMSVINMVGVSSAVYLDEKPVIGWIEPGSPAEKAQLRVGDEILRINRRATNTWSDVELEVGTKPKRLVRVQVRRGGEVLTVGLRTESKSRYEMGYAGFAAFIRTQVMMVEPGSPAEKAGFQPGDIIHEINGTPVHFYEFTKVIQEHPEEELDVKVRRGDAFVLLKVTPRRRDDVGMIGVATQMESTTRTYGFFAAIGQSVRENARLAFLVVNFVKDLLTGEASARQLGGPIEIASFSYTAFRMGLVTLMWWIAFISLQLGVINLFPIPMFDGGHILVLGLEGLFRRDFSPRVKQIVMQIGFVLIIILFTFIILNDVVKRLPNGWESLVPW
ncbi:MAG: RIP metalloprotease RseP [Candidatus Aminicenantales bacterium]